MEFQTAQARYNLLPGNIQKMFCEREGVYNFWGKLNLKTLSTTMKKMLYLNLWSETVCMHVKLNQCPNIIQFKQIMKLEGL